MKTINCLTILCLLILNNKDSRCNEYEVLSPMRYISSCQLDLDNDKNIDIAFLAITNYGWELIVLLYKPDGYKAYVLSKGKENMYLTGHYGSRIKATIAGNGKKQKSKPIKTNGTYLQLHAPEGSAVAYYWGREKFQEVWVSD